MGDVLVKGIGDKDDAAISNISNIKEDFREKKRPVQIKRTGEGKSDTVGLEGLGLTPPTKNINPASMPASSLTNEQRQAINELVASQGEKEQYEKLVKVLTPKRLTLYAQREKPI